MVLPDTFLNVANKVVGEVPPTTLELPMGVILEGIHLDREMKAVLLGEKSRLAPLYGLMLAQENADWERVSSISKDLKLDEAFVAECHWKAMQWAREMTTGS